MGHTGRGSVGAVSPGTGMNAGTGIQLNNLYSNPIDKNQIKGQQQQS